LDVVSDSSTEAGSLPEPSFNSAYIRAHNRNAGNREGYRTGSRRDGESDVRNLPDRGQKRFDAPGSLISRECSTSVLQKSCSGYGILRAGLLMTASAKLTPDEELLLEQLQQLRYWQEACKPSSSSTTDNLEIGSSSESLPGKWELTRGIQLHEWQRSCISAWMENDRRGIIKVVTGAGKTVLALAIIQELQRDCAPQLRVAVVVPTIILLQQWRDEILERGNLPASAIGIVGAGEDDHFSEEVRILICVLNSASKKLPQEVDRAAVADQLLLIVDECHRAGSAEMKRLFQTRRTYSLGLSATPERDEEASDSESELGASDDAVAVSFDETVLGLELGKIVFEMNYADAIRAGVLPPFRIVHYGLNLSAKERQHYEEISREIKELRADLETRNRKGLALIRWCRSKAAAGNPKAARLVARTTERKRFLYQIEQRGTAVNSILRSAFSDGSEASAILFHESIDEVMRLFASLREAGYPVVAEHSGFPDSLRAEALRLFRTGTARIIVSARSLIEGFNVPTADIGIIVAASSSIRQRVQTLGRLLRKNRRQDGSEKQATLYVLYASNTVDEMIYEKADWEQFVGANRNEYFTWSDVQSSDPESTPGPPRRPLIDESAVDASQLKIGQPYPGNPAEGRLYSLDTQGTVRDENGALIRPHPQLRALLNGQLSGRFRVTPKKQFVLKLEKLQEGWQSTYLGTLDYQIEIAEQYSSHSKTTREYAQGDPYPLEDVHGPQFSVLQRDKRLIAKKTGSKIQFVVPFESLEEAKGIALRQIQNRLADLYRSGKRVNKIQVTGEGHVVYVFNGEAYFLGYAPEGPGGFALEEVRDSE
jgi:superfamily II DNA or RNA helicase